jgi:hypothetical protein
MAVYKIFPDKDATIYSAYPKKNTGLDEILEVSVKNSLDDLNPAYATGSLVKEDVRRSLLTFSNSDLSTIKSFSTGSWKAFLRLYLANAENLSSNYYLEVRQLSQSYDMGTGQYGDDPETRNGVCWYSTSSYFSASSSWDLNNGKFYTVSGGGSWSSLSTTCSFTNSSDKDVNCDITAIVNSWFSGSSNNGLIVKHPDSVEGNGYSYVALSYFSVDTHTIYPPAIEMRWDDSSYVTGSLSVISNSDFVVTLANNYGDFKQGAKYKFRINARDKYPVRQFTTQSIYLNNKALPQQSYWAVQDVKTEEMVVDFDSNYTKISCDSVGNYFVLHTSGLEPERYYKILVKSVIATGETVIMDMNNILKITR